MNFTATRRIVQIAIRGPVRNGTMLSVSAGNAPAATLIEWDDYARPYGSPDRMARAVVRGLRRAVARAEDGERDGLRAADTHDF